MTLSSLDQHIEATPGICGGRPRIAGRRISVQNVVIWHERLGMSADEIAAEHDVTLADIYAALAYYYDHQEEIDKAIQEDDGLADSLRQLTPSKLPEKFKGLS